MLRSTSHTGVPAVSISASVLILTIMASFAPAKLVLETRFAGRDFEGPAQVGEVFRYGVYAVVTGLNQDLTDEALQSIHGRFISTDVNGGILRGNLASTPLRPYNDLPSVGGTPTDLDGDGDLDLGSSDPTQAEGWFVARVAPYKGIPYSTGIPQEFKFADLTFTVTTVLEGGAGADTLIRFEQRPYETAGLWIVDGQLRSWYFPDGAAQGPGPSLAAGEAIPDPEGFHFPPASLRAAVPEPSLACLLVLAATLIRARRKSA
jgi:hypothetical protein